MKQIIFYGLSIAMSWTAVGLLVATYNESQANFSAPSHQYPKKVVFEHAKVAEALADSTFDAVAADEVAQEEDIPVTIMQIPSPLPRAKPPKTGKDAAPPPMEI